MRSTASSSFEIREFSFDLDGGWLHALWNRTLHKRWAISFKTMLNILSDASLLRVAVSNGQRSGFCAVDSRTGQSAGLVLLLVEPAMQRQGIGTKLCRLLERLLLEQQKDLWKVGAGNGDYFWPGIPAEHDDAWSFFKKLGFEEQEHSKDLVQDLDDFHKPAWVLTRQVASRTTLHLGEPARAPELLAFEQSYFPAWLPYFRNELDQGNYSNVLFAQGADGAISGTILMRSEAATPWLHEAGKRVGTLNTLGVAPQQQGQGIGLALTAGAMEYLRESGCASCYIQWTGLTKWYGKLGARPWASYRMAEKRL